MIAFILSLLLLLLPTPVNAIYDPTSVPNNKYGIHIADFNDIADTALLINSNGGDWGYITLVASDNDRDPTKWQVMFDEMRRLHIIPIVRLATHVEKSSWVVPNKDKLDELVTFFTNLNWPTQNRYIILYNEPNHAKEWGDKIDPEGYADIAVTLAQKFKKSSEDFFVLPAGLDVSAQSDGIALDAGEFIKRMIQAKPELLTVIDGWTSHAYPNPGFSGSPYASGRGSIRSYEWELSLLSQLGLTKKLPIFITETGWQHSQGKVFQSNLLSPLQVGENLRFAAKNVWNDARIVSVTPFLFNYQDIPFDHFSWKMLGDGNFYAQYQIYKDIEKVKGFPIQKEEYRTTSPLLPSTLVTDSDYVFTAELSNAGQGILNSEEYGLLLSSDPDGFSYTYEPLPTIEPNQKRTITMTIHTPEKTGMYSASLQLDHLGRTIPLATRTMQLVPPPSLHISINLGWKTVSNAKSIKVLVYNDKTLLHEFTNLELINGVITVNNLRNIVPGEKYRVVVVVPYYLPRQTIVPLSKDETVVTMKRLLPFDIDNDGALTIKDLFTLPKEQPHVIRKRFFGP